MLVPNPLTPAPNSTAAYASCEHVCRCIDLRGDAAWRPLCAGLSNDYLNHYSEMLMLIETAMDDPASPMS